MSRGARFQGFWGLSVVEIFGSGYVSQNNRFYHVLSVCGAVGVCGERHRVGHVVIILTPEGHF